MKIKALLCWILVMVVTCAVFAQTTEFTYQGNLKNGAAAATGNFDFEFQLFDASSGGTQLGSTITTNTVAVANGTFAVKLDFGSQFPGASRFLEIHVRQTGGGAFTPLTPRQSVSSAPYSVKSLNADNAATATNATQLGGVAANQFVLTADPRLSDARTPAAGSVNYIQNGSSQQAASNFNISGNGTIGGKLIANSNVGIGTTNPVTRLHVEGNPADTLIFGNNLAGGNGVRGYSSTGTGVSGQGGSSFGSGVFGNGNYGVEGATFSPGDPIASIAVYGHAESLTGATFGVWGETQSNSGRGVRGWAHSQTGSTIGVDGTSDSSAGAGVSGIASSSTGSTCGVCGTSYSNAGRGVGGFSTGGFGVAGTAVSASIHFGTAYVGSASVWGTTTTSVGVFGTSDSNVGVVGVSQSNYGILGRSITGDAARFEGRVVVTTLGTGGSLSLCWNGTGQLSTCSSSLRYKKNIGQFGAGLGLIRQLKPITFDWKDGGMHDLGLGAEDVAKIEPLLVTYNDKGQIEGVKYDRIGVVLINAVKEQQAQIENLEKQNASQQKQIELLMKIVCLRNRAGKVCKGAAGPR